jgi:hypothetical protein
VAQVGLLWLTSTPDRRHLWLTVPCAILGAHVLGYAPRAGRAISELAPDSGERWRACGLGVAMAAALAVYLRPPLASALEPLARNLPLGFETGLSVGTLCAIVVFGICALGALLGPAAAGALRRTPLRWGTVALGVAVFAVVLAGVRLTQEVTHRSYELRRVSNEIRSIVGAESAVAGGAIVTLLLDAPNRTLVIHDRLMYGFGVYGLAHLDEANPSHFVFDWALDPAAAPEETRRALGGLRSAVPSSIRIVRGVHRMVGAEDQPMEFTVVRLSDGE